MKSQVNYVYDFEDDPVDELKHWLFLENVILNQQKQQLEDEYEPGTSFVLPSYHRG